MPRTPEASPSIPPEVFTLRLKGQDAADFRRLLTSAQANVSPGARQTRHGFAEYLLRLGMDSIDPVPKRRKG